MITLLTPPCPQCREQTSLEVTEEQFKQLEEGRKLIQDIFPDWPADQRELLITGIHPECWKRIFGEEDES